MDRDSVIEECAQRVERIPHNEVVVGVLEQELLEYAVKTIRNLKNEKSK